MHLESTVVDYIREAATSDRYAAYLRNTLLDLLAFNTAPGAQIANIAAHEQELFDWISREVGDLLGKDAIIERSPIDAAIAEDSDYTHPRYAADVEGIVPSVDTLYAGRNNLLVIARAAGDGRRLAVILHTCVDVKSPWFAPRAVGERVFGRGVCDSKTQVAMLLAQMKLFREVEEKFGKRANRARAYQFVIDGTSGGNGSLNRAMDSRLAGIPVLMHSSTDMVPCCAHRGTLWYRCRLSVGNNNDRTAVELFPFVVQALEEENQKLRQETSHALFTNAHVQSNHGILGVYGSSPDEACEHVAIEIIARAKANHQRVAMKITEFLEEALANYVRIYGDKTVEKDPATGKPKLDRHFEVKATATTETQNFRIDIWGKSGLADNFADGDGAITKAAYLLGALLRIAGSFPGIQARGRLADADGDDRTLVLEGTQSFTASHTMADVQARMTATARAAVRQYCQIRKCEYDDDMVVMTFDHLHSDALVGDDDNVLKEALGEAFAAIGESWPESWALNAYCDAGIFHRKGHDVAIFGAGKPEHTGRDDEYVDIPDIQKALAISTLATWAMIK